MATRAGFRRKVTIALLLGAVALPLLILGSSWLLATLFYAVGVALLVELVIFAVRRARNLTSWLLCAILACLVAAGIWGMQMVIWSPHGNWLLLSAVVVIVATDTAAQLVGMRFGTPGTFMPSISPNKSRTGVLAGVAGGVSTALVAIIIWWLLGAALSPLVATALIVAPALSVAGDLFESRVKRSLGIKDFGRALGRDTGGFMDRFDSWLPTFFVIGLALLLS